MRLAILIGVVAVLCVTPPPAGQTGAADRPMWVEFDAPESLRSFTPDGLPIVRGFRIGYFFEGADQPSWTFDVDRTNLPRTDGLKLKLRLPQPNVREAGTFVVRVKTLGAYGESEWSEPSQSFTKPVHTGVVASNDRKSRSGSSVARRGREAPEKQPRNRAGRRSRSEAPGGKTADARSRGRQSVSAWLEANPSVAAKVKARLPNGMTMKEAAAGFPTPADLLVALHAAHNLQIPFRDLKALVASPSPKGLAEAIKELRPAAEADAEIKRAMRQARTDIRESHGRPPETRPDRDTPRADPGAGRKR